MPPTTLNIYENAPNIFVLIIGAAIGVVSLFYFLYRLTNPPSHELVYEHDQSDINSWEESAYEPYEEPLQPVYEPQPVVQPVMALQPQLVLRNNPISREEVLDQLLAKPVDVQPLAVQPPIEQAVEAPIEKPKEYRFYVGKKRGVERLHTLDHFRINRRTGGGKSVILARIIPQLLAQGVEVWYINPKYMPLDEAGLDIQPIVDRCARIAISSDGRDAFHLLMEAKLLPRQRVTEAQQTKRAVFNPIVIIVEELQTLMELWNDLDLNDAPGFKKAAKRGNSAINVILATGRQPKVFYGTTSQDAQVQNTGVNTGIGNNFGLSVMHPSLDRASLSNLTGGAYTEADFPIAQSPYEWYTFEKTSGLGKGELHMVHVPMVTNEWIMDTLKDVPIVERGTDGTQDNENNSPEKKLTENPVNQGSESVKTNGTPDAQPVPRSTFHGHVPFSEILQLSGTPPESDVPEEELDKFKSVDLVRAAVYMQDCPNPTKRELADHLWGKSDGRYNTRAGAIMEEVRRMMKGKTDAKEQTELPTNQASIVKGDCSPNLEAPEPIDLVVIA